MHTVAWVQNMASQTCLTSFQSISMQSQPVYVSLDEFFFFLNPVFCASILLTCPPQSSCSRNLIPHIMYHVSDTLRWSHMGVVT